ncbi:MAG: LacI family transcriptional regulator [Porphyromonadaceae bacterium]|jgi:LacI family transcriptional regulator|nr:LacI family transcriptional regulator [Porphyromonadaceae bacterium]
MAKRQVTIVDIAKKLNISASTVSRALKNHPDISKETIERVKECAAKMNYIPNEMALNLRMKRTNVIGVIVPEIVHYFFSSIVQGIEEVASEEGFNVMLFRSEESYEKELKITDSLISARVAGVLASLSKETDIYDHYQRILDNDIQLVFYDRICIGIITDRVVVDDYAGALTAVEYLISTGCKRIAFYSSPTHLEISKNRRNGYLDALRKHKLPVDQELMFVCDTREAAMELTPKVLAMDNPPDAFFAINDHTATGILYAVKQTGLRVPEDISICGFSGGDLALACDPMLTTVEQHGYEVGKTAAKLLIDKINGVTLGQFTNRIIKTKLMVRGTTKAAP